MAQLFPSPFVPCSQFICPRCGEGFITAHEIASILRPVLAHVFPQLASAPMSLRGGRVRVVLPFPGYAQVLAHWVRYNLIWSRNPQVSSLSFATIQVRGRVVVLSRVCGHC